MSNSIYIAKEDLSAERHCFRASAAQRVQLPDTITPDFDGAYFLPLHDVILVPIGADVNVRDLLQAPTTTRHIWFQYLSQHVSLDINGERYSDVYKLLTFTTFPCDRTLNPGYLQDGSESLSTRHFRQNSYVYTSRHITSGFVGPLAYGSKTKRVPPATARRLRLNPQAPIGRCFPKVQVSSVKEWVDDFTR